MMTTDKARVCSSLLPFGLVVSGDSDERRAVGLPAALPACCVSLFYIQVDRSTWVVSRKVCYPSVWRR